MLGRVGKCTLKPHSIELENVLPLIQVASLVQMSVRNIFHLFINDIVCSTLIYFICRSILECLVPFYDFYVGLQTCTELE